ncbi:CG33777, partial [Drosophila busckii]
MLHHPVHDAFIKGDLMKKANGYKPWLYSANFDGCQFIRRRNNPIIRLIWEFFKEFSNINHTCPYVSALVFKMTNAVCESRNKSWVIIDTCRLHAVQRNKTILNIELTILHPTNSVTLRLQILRKANGYKPWIIDSTFDACKFVRNPKINPIGKMVYGLFEDFSSINHPCPYV